MDTCYCTGPMRGTALCRCQAYSATRSLCVKMIQLSPGTVVPTDPGKRQTTYVPSRHTEKDSTDVVSTPVPQVPESVVKFDGGQYTVQSGAVCDEEQDEEDILGLGRLISDAVSLRRESR